LFTVVSIVEISSFIFERVVSRFILFVMFSTNSSACDFSSFISSVLVCFVISFILRKFLSICFIEFRIAPASLGKNSWETWWFLATIFSNEDIFLSNSLDISIRSSKLFGISNLSRNVSSFLR